MFVYVRHRRDQGYRGVWRELAHSGRAGDRPAPSSSGLAQARRRVGLAPLAALFARVRGTRATAETQGAFRFGLRLVAWDGTMLDTPGQRGQHRGVHPVG